MSPPSLSPSLFPSFSLFVPYLPSLTNFWFKKRGVRNLSCIFIISLPIIMTEIKMWSEELTSFWVAAVNVFFSLFVSRIVGWKDLTLCTLFSTCLIPLSALVLVWKKWSQ